MFQVIGCFDVVGNGIFWQGRRRRRIHPVACQTAEPLNNKTANGSQYFHFQFLNSFFSSSISLGLFCSCFIIVSFECAIHVLTNAFYVFSLGVSGVSSWLVKRSMQACASQNAKEPPPKRVWIPPIVLWNSILHFLI